MNPGRRLQCPDCKWWGGHAMTCPEMSKPNPRPGIRDKPLFEFADVDPSDPAMAARLSDLGANDNTTSPGGDGDAGTLGYGGGAAAAAAAAAAPPAAGLTATPSADALEAELATLGTDGAIRSDRLAALMADSIAELTTDNPDELAIEAPDMTNTGATQIQAEFHKCSLCKIKVPSADADTYTAEKRCPINRDGCPFTRSADQGCSRPVDDIEDLARSQRADAVRQAALKTGQAAVPANLTGYADVSPERNRSVRKKVLREGGGGARPQPGDTVSVHYIGTFPENGKVFDSSRRRNAPFSFELGKGVIKGWSEGVATMERSELASFFLAPSKGYGAAGQPFGGIAPNASLMFEIELLGWRSDKAEPTAAREPLSSAADIPEASESDDEGYQAPPKDTPPALPPRTPSLRGGRGRTPARNGCELHIMVVAMTGIILAMYAAHAL